MPVSRAKATIVGATIVLLASLVGATPPARAQGYSDPPWWNGDRPWWQGQRPIRRPPYRYDRYDDADEDYERPPVRRNGQNDDGQDYGDQGDDWRDEQDRRPQRRASPPRWDDDQGGDAEERSAGKPAGVDGGPRPYIALQTPPMVPFSGAYAAGSIIIDTNARKLYYVTRPTAAFAYPIGVGREGFSWTGSEKVSNITDWPDWYPPAEMRKRKPELPERMLGGLNNPLGAKAIYLGNTLYRIHGTNDPKSIGRAESSGCFRMLNAHVLHLASLVQVGTPVTVVRSLGNPVVASKQPAPAPKVTQKARPLPRWQYRGNRSAPWWEYDPPDDFR